MKHAFAPLMVILLYGAIIAGAQVSNEAPPPSFENDFALMLTGEATWKDQLLPGQWDVVSKQATGTMKESSTAETTFGFTPTRIQAYITGETLDRIVVIYLETGEFFGESEAEKLKDRPAKTYKEQQQLARQIQDAKKQDEGTMKAKRKAFNERFAELKAHLQPNMEQVLGIKGKPTIVGMGNLCSHVVDFPYQDLILRLDIEEGQLIAVTIQRKEDAGRKLLNAKTQTMAGRRKDVKQNVTTMENGDVVIDNIPMLTQGERQYCAVGTLAMVAQYYGLEVNVDILAAKANYREGDVAQANIRPIYRATASEAKLSMNETVGFPFVQVKRYIEKGQPVVVWRAFSEERDNFHSQFARAFRQDPTKTLPDPHKNFRDKQNWPTTKTGGHASLITGFNKPRKEVLFTESWGEDTRNRRMRIEEMETTTHFTFFFDP